MTGMEELAEAARLETARVYSTTSSENTAARPAGPTAIERQRIDELAWRRSKRAEYSRQQRALARQAKQA